MPNVPELVKNFANLLNAKKWDGASINGAKPVPLTADVRVGFETDHFWIKFKFKENEADVEVEAQITLKGDEKVLKNGVELPGGKVAGKPLAAVTGSLPPKGKAKIALILKYGTGATAGSYRFDVTIAST